MECPGNLTRQKEACPCLAAEISCLSLFEIPDVERSGKTTIFWLSGPTLAQLLE